MIKVTHVINGLMTGGAEVALSRLLAGVDRERFEMDVIALDPRMGEIAEVIRRDGWSVKSVNMTKRGAPQGVARLVRWLRQDTPHIVQAWMYHAGLVASLSARLAGVPAVAWNLRQSDLRPDLNKRTALIAARVSARLSWRVPDAVVCGSRRAEEFHRELGFRPDRLTVIQNGFPIPDVGGDERVWLRTHLGLPPQTPLVGRIGRFHPYKDYRSMVIAAGRIAQARPAVHFVLCGREVDASNLELRHCVAEQGLDDRVHLLGERTDITRINAGLDVACSTSLGEGFPNVVAEAMSVGVPVVATDVGDTREVVGDTGFVVAAGAPNEVAEAVLALLAMPDQQRAALGTAAQDRIREQFSLRRMAERYEDLYAAVTAAASPARLDGEPSPGR